MDGIERALLVAVRLAFLSSTGKLAWLESFEVALLERDTGACLRWSPLRRQKSFSIELSESSSSLDTTVLGIVACTLLSGRSPDIANGLAVSVSLELSVTMPWVWLKEVDPEILRASLLPRLMEENCDCRAPRGGRLSEMLRVGWVRARESPSWERLKAAARVPVVTEATLVNEIGFFLGLSIRLWR